MKNTKGFRNLKRQPEVAISPLVWSLTTRPNFEYLEKVWVKTMKIPGTNPTIMRGKIMGKAEMFDIWDYWIVQLRHYPNDNYKYSCAAFRHDCVMVRLSNKKPKEWKS